MLQTTVPVNVHLNFRSMSHLEPCRTWLRQRGWRANRAITSVRSSGYPNGPYSGPTYSQSFEAGTVELMGSANWEGTYFVFIELLDHTSPPPDAAAAESSQAVAAEPSRTIAAPS